MLNTSSLDFRKYMFKHRVLLLSRHYNIEAIEFSAQKKFAPNFKCFNADVQEVSELN